MIVITYILGIIVCYCSYSWNLVIDFQEKIWLHPAIVKEHKSMSIDHVSITGDQLRWINLYTCYLQMVSVMS